MFLVECQNGIVLLSAYEGMYVRRVLTLAKRLENLNEDSVPCPVLCIFVGQTLPIYFDYPWIPVK